MYICVAVVIWGAISAATAAVNTYGQLLAVRAILGIVEAVFFPGAVYYLSAWYTKKELGKRLAGLYIAQQVGNAFGGLFAAAILQLDGQHGIAGWKWLFIIEGSATVGIGAICVSTTTSTLPGAILRFRELLRLPRFGLWTRLILHTRHASCPSILTTAPACCRRSKESLLCGAWSLKPVQQRAQKRRTRFVASWMP